MKKMKFTVLLLCGALLLGSCGTMNNKAKGGIIGGGSGAAAGAIIGGLIGKGKGAAIGAAVGAAVGTGAGVAIGHKMDKKAAEAAKIEGAQVEQVTDANGLPAVKVSFAAGILFGFNSAAEQRGKGFPARTRTDSEGRPDNRYRHHRPYRQSGYLRSQHESFQEPRLCRRELFAGLRRISGPVQESGRRGIQRIRRKSVCRPEPTRRGIYVCQRTDD